MDYSFIWKSVVVYLGGFFLVRFVGRKSVSQITLSTTIVMIAVGAIMVQPIVVDTLPRTLIAVAVFILTLIIVEYLQLKSKFFAKLFHGKAKIVISNGQLQEANLKKLRMTKDKLEMQIRQSGISDIRTIKTGTIEANGMFGYELFPEEKPLTVGEFKKLMSQIINTDQSYSSGNQGDNVFQEIKEYETKDK